MSVVKKLRRKKMRENVEAHVRQDKRFEKKTVSQQQHAIKAISRAILRKAKKPTS